MTTETLASCGAPMLAISPTPGSRKPDPILVVDGVRRTFGGVHAVVNPFAIFFFVSMLLCVGAQFLLGRIHGDHEFADGGEIGRGVAAFDAVQRFRPHARPPCLLDDGHQRIVRGAKISQRLVPDCAGIHVALFG